MVYCAATRPGVRFSPSDPAPHAEVKSRSIARSRGEQDGRQAGRQSRHQHGHRTVGCPVPIGSRLFPLDRTKRERHNSLNLNGSEGACPAAPTVPAVFAWPLWPAAFPRQMRLEQQPGRCCPPGGQFMPVFARYCPVSGEISWGFSQRPRVSSPPPRISGSVSLAAGTVPVFPGQVGFLRVVLGLNRDPDAVSFPLEVCGVAWLFGSICASSSRSSNLPPSACRFRYLRSLAGCGKTRDLVDREASPC
jgi:hypothetical protein